MQTLIELQNKIAELERRNAHLADALNRIVTKDVGTAKCVSIAYKALSATSADTEAWLQAEIVKRLGGPVAIVTIGGSGVHWMVKQEDVPQYPTPLYCLPFPLATPEERKD